MNSTEKEIRESAKKQVTEMADSLSALCIRAKIPLFISFAYQDDNSEELHYDNRIVSASLEMPGYAKRINKLILAVNNCGLKLPDHIQRDIDELENWLSNEGDFTSEDRTVNKFRDFLDIANGQVEATIPTDINTSDMEEIEVVAKKSGKKKEK